MPFVEVPADLCCPIACDLFQDPVFTKTGDSYSRLPIERWFATCDEKKQPLTSPATNEVLTSRDLIPNRELQSRVSKFRESLLTGKALQAAIEAGDVKKLESSNIVKSDLHGPFQVVFPPKGPFDVSALTVAVSCRNIDTVRFLLPHVEIDAGSDGSALYFASGYASAMVPILLAGNANVNLQDDDGFAPIHIAAEQNPSVIPLLVSKGANVNIRTKEGMPPLMFAKSIETVKSLVSAGANLFAVDLNNESILFDGNIRKDSKFFCELAEIMNKTDRQKFIAALQALHHNGNRSIAEAVGSSVDPRLLRALLSLCLNSGGIMVGAYAGWTKVACAKVALSMADGKSDDLERLGIFGALWNGLVAGFDTDKSVESAIKCIEILAEFGGSRFIDLTRENGWSPLLFLTKKMISIADGLVANPSNRMKKKLDGLIRIMMTMIQIGADRQRKDDNGKTIVELLRGSVVLWKAFEVCLPFFNIAVSKPAAVSVDADSKAASSEPSVDRVAKRSGADSGSKRQAKRVRPNAAAGSSSAAAAAQPASSSSAAAAAAAASTEVIEDDE